MLLSIARRTYTTYRGDRAFHRLRVVASVVVALVISLTGVDLEKSTFQVSSLVITVLAGFVFTALFSNYSVTTAGLEPPVNESDRADIVLLKKLGENFSIRSRYFMILALSDLVLIILLTTKLSFPFDHRSINFIVDISAGAVGLARYAANFVEVACKAVAILLFFECLYTFYRLAETILAVLDIRKSYANAKLK